MAERQKDNGLLPHSPDEGLIPDLSSGDREQVLAEGHKSVLRQLVEGLQADESVYFAGEFRSASKDPKSRIVEDVWVVVAPVSEAEGIVGLNAFMHGLVPDIERTHSSDAHERRSDSFTLGRLHFHEPVATVARQVTETVTSAESEVLVRAGIQPGVSVRQETGTLERITKVLVYPDTESAKALMKYLELDREDRLQGEMIWGEFAGLLHTYNQEEMSRLQGFLRDLKV